MVGAAQYLDEEIDWVLSAVVGKKKQSYIQTHFKDKFGRSLNHNQIRYIKNKYGKDPRFKIATSPKPGGVSDLGDETEQGNHIDFGSPSEVGPSKAVEKRQSEQKDEVAAVARVKRKRGLEDSGDGRSRLVKKIVGSQRLELQRERVPSKTVELETSLHQWNTLDLQPSTSHAYPPSTTVASHADEFLDTLYVAAHDGAQQSTPVQVHNTSTGIGWAPSVSLSTWMAANSPVFTSVSENVVPSALVLPTATVEQLYHRPAAQTNMLLQTPVTTQYQLQLPQPCLATSSISPFSILTPSAAPSPFHNYQEQQPYELSQIKQELHSPIEAPEAHVFPNLAISGVEGYPYPDSLSNVAFPLVPSFQEMPIEPASCHGVSEPPTLATDDVREHH
ncbi:hypothetical protein V8C35DRAFT_275397 [Trichoderma chlorosporum]